MKQSFCGHLGYADDTSIRLWLMSTKPCQVRCVLTSNGNNHTKELALEKPNLAGAIGFEELAPGTITWEWQVRDDDAWRKVAGVGTAGTWTLGASDPDHFVIGVTSCNNLLTDYPPFPKDPSERWRAIPALHTEDPFDLFVHVGDQVYLDPEFAPYMSGTLAGPAAQRQAIKGWPESIRKRYEGHLAHPHVARALATIPNVMMWDDHELYDGWGSQQFASRAADAWERAATDAFRDWQASHNPPPLPNAGFAFATTRGRVGIIALDLRTFRGRDKASSMLGTTQFTAIKEWWTSAKENVRALVILSSTPIGHLWGKAWKDLYKFLILPQWRLDLKDLWTCPNNGNQEALIALLDWITNDVINDPTRSVLIVSGDVHMSHAPTITHTNGRVIQEFVCSPIANVIPGFAAKTVNDTLQQQQEDPPSIGNYTLTINDTRIFEQNTGRITINLTNTPPTYDLTCHTKNKTTSLTPPGAKG